jgi:hypothetical protein
MTELYKETAATVIFLGLISVSINVSEQQMIDMPLNNRSSTDDINSISNFSRGPKN